MEKLGFYDIIISNPPYVLESEKKLMDRNVLAYEPSIAIFVPDDDPLKFFKVIAKIAKQRLKSQGQLYFEINEVMGLEIAEMLLEEGY